MFRSARRYLGRSSSGKRCPASKQSTKWLAFIAFPIVLAWSTATAEPAKWVEEGWRKTDFTRSTIAWTEIVSGGSPKDGIPSIDKPQFQSAAQDRSLSANEPVIGLEINDDARAYPLRILIWHEIVNDEVGGVPVVATYCPLCNSAIVFERRFSSQLLDFGTTGKLRNSDLVMYDRQTETWWQQFTGEALVGELVGSTLRMVPSRLESFAQFKRRFPRGKVLIPNDPKLRDYGRNPYFGYDMGAAPLLFNGEYPKDVEPMARVVVVRSPLRKPFAITLELLRQKRSYKRDGIELVWQHGQSTALDHWNIADGRDVGSVTAFVVGDDGVARDVPYDVTFAFAVFAFHPDILIIKECDETPRGPLPTLLNLTDCVEIEDETHHFGSALVTTGYARVLGRRIDRQAKQVFGQGDG